MKTGLNQPKEFLTIKDEGDFFQIKLTQDGKIPDGNKMYPFGSLQVRTFATEQEAKAFAKSIGVAYRLA